MASDFESGRETQLRSGLHRTILHFNGVECYGASIMASSMSISCALGFRFFGSVTRRTIFG
jgi:hypothetical protein